MWYIRTCTDWWISVGDMISDHGVRVAQRCAFPAGSNLEHKETTWGIVNQTSIRLDCDWVKGEASSLGRHPWSLNTCCFRGACSHAHCFNYKPVISPSSQLCFRQTNCPSFPFRSNIATSLSGAKVLTDESYCKFLRTKDRIYSLIEAEPEDATSMRHVRVFI